MTNSFDEAQPKLFRLDLNLFSLQGLQSVLVVNYNSIYNNGFIAISAGVFATVMYLLLYSWCNSYLQMSVFFHIYLFMVFCNCPQKGVWKFGPAIFIVSLVRTLRCVSCSFRAMTISQVFAAPTTMFRCFCDDG